MNNIEINSVKTGASLLDTLTSALYANPIVTFREYVQNAIDSFSSSETTRDKKIEIFINSELNQIIISDNGNGIPTAEFKEKMCSFGQSSKMGHQDQLGFRGIGRLSGLSFCETLHFINKADPENPQYFSLNGKNYREILSGAEGGSESLTNVLNRIASTEKPRNLDLKNNERGFEVVMTNITDELWDCICSVKIGRGKNKATNTPQNLQKRMPSESFINELSMLLPIPYNNEFKSAEGIYNKYKEALGVDLHIREFKVFLDGKQLFKPFEDAPTSAFQIIPIKIVSTSIQSEEKKYITIGLLWMRFDYVFRAVKQNWGIAVRSKNMLVRGGSVLAEEAANDRDAITSYGQYLAALKGVTGELLLENNLLSDNSRRDWFKVDANSIQLRNQLCQLMNRMHTYRYKISRYIHNDKKTEIEKESVIDSYRKLTSQQVENLPVTAVEQFIERQLQSEAEVVIDDRADEHDILGYTTTQKRFYKRLMMAIYDYFGDEEKDYYKLKSYILQDLNSESIESENEVKE